jgi:hypothetical protein
MLLIGFLTYWAYLKIDFKSLYLDFLKKDKITIEKAQNIKIIENVLELPNHITLNDKIEQKVKSVLETIPEEMFIKELKIDKDILELKGNFLNENTFADTLKPNLRKLYKEANFTNLSIDKKINIEGVVLAKNDIELSRTYKFYNKQYLVDEFIPLEGVTEQLKILMPVGSIIKLNTTTSSSSITRFMYTVNILIREPKEFFNVIELLNNELYSIHISYPLSMVKTPAGIEAEFILVFNQPNEVKTPTK